MKSFTKKEQVVILIVVFIIIVSLGFKFFLKDMFKPRGITMELNNSEEIFQEYDENPENKEEDHGEEEGLEIMVHISGQVYKPGIIQLEAGDRLVDGVELAGGLKKDADLDRINLAKKLVDEEKIYIPMIGEDIDISMDTGSIELGGSESSGDEKININTCTKEELIKLPGIGEVIAGRIVEYRSENHFKAIDDIKSVSGIGDKKFESIKDLIRVK